MQTFISVCLQKYTNTYIHVRNLIIWCFEQLPRRQLLQYPWLVTWKIRSMQNWDQDSLQSLHCQHWDDPPCRSFVVDEDGTINCLSFQQVDFHIYSSCILRCSNSLYSAFMKESKSKAQTDVREFFLSAFKRSHKCAFLIVVAFVFVFLCCRVCL